jgi:hypothetical protein
MYSITPASLLGTEFMNLGPHIPFEGVDDRAGAHNVSSEVSVMCRLYEKDILLGYIVPYQLRWI